MIKSIVFGEVCKAIPGITSSLFSSRLYSYLNDAYAEPWRKYHTEEHINTMIDALREMGCTDTAVYVAAYFHDVVWLPSYAEAEERSAEVAVYWLRTYGAETDFIDNVERLILATKHNGLRPVDLAEAQIRDADLWSLGADFDAFMRTQHQVRAEFARVPEDVYMQARRDIFARFGKIQFFWTPEGVKRELRARRNLEWTHVIDRPENMVDCGWCDGRHEQYAGVDDGREWALWMMDHCPWFAPAAIKANLSQNSIAIKTVPLASIAGVKFVTATATTGAIDLSPSIVLHYVG